MRKLVICLLVLGLCAIQTIGHTNSDPAPGRSPGPPYNDAEALTATDSTHSANSTANKYLINNNDNADYSGDDEDDNETTIADGYASNSVIDKNHQHSSNEQKFNNYDNNYSILANDSYSSHILDQLNGNKNSLDFLSQSMDTKVNAIQLQLNNSDKQLIETSSTKDNKAAAAIQQNNQANFQNLYQSTRDKDGTVFSQSSSVNKNLEQNYEEIAFEKYSKEIEHKSNVEAKENQNYEQPVPQCQRDFHDIFSDANVIDISNKNVNESNSNSSSAADHYDFDIQLGLQHDVFDATSTTFGINCGLLYKGKYSERTNKINSNYILTIIVVRDSWD